MVVGGNTIGNPGSLGSQGPTGGSRRRAGGVFGTGLDCIPAGSVASRGFWDGGSGCFRHSLSRLACENTRRPLPNPIRTIILRALGVAGARLRNTFSSIPSRFRSAGWRLGQPRRRRRAKPRGGPRQSAYRAARAGIFMTRTSAQESLEPPPQRPPEPA